MVAALNITRLRKKQDIVHSEVEVFLNIRCNDPYCRTERKPVDMADRIGCVSSPRNRPRQKCLGDRPPNRSRDAWYDWNSEYTECWKIHCIDYMIHGRGSTCHQQRIPL